MNYHFTNDPAWLEPYKATAAGHPDGVVVAVPKRGGLLYAPLSDEAAVGRLRRGVRQLHASSGRLGVSAALYLFKDGRWSVLQAAPAP